MINNELTEAEYWDQHWSKIRLPSEVTKLPYSPMNTEIINLFDRFLDVDQNKTALEIGGAPGRFLAYVAKNFQYKCNALDYSKRGCEKIRENFELLGLKVNVINEDITKPLIHLPKYDFVYSLGVVEHFENYLDIVKAHSNLVKQNGILIIGVPNFILAYSAIFNILAPKTMKQHNLDSIAISNWAIIEEQLNLKVLFKGYVGGFEPMLIRAVVADEGFNNFTTRLLIFMLDVYGKLRGYLYRYIPITRYFQKIDSIYWSSWAITVYQKTN